MADVAISGLTALGGAPATNDLLVEVDVSDTTQAPTGTTKKMTVANLFTAPAISAPVISSGMTATGVVGVGQQIVALTGDLDLDSKPATAGTVRVNRSGGTGGFTVFAGNTTTANFSVSDAGVATHRGNVIVASGGITVTGNSSITGTLTVSGTTQVSTLLQFGGATSSFPAIQRAAATLSVVLADTSGFANLTAAALSGTAVNSSGAVSCATGFIVGVNQVVGARNTGWATQTVTTGAKTDIGASGTWTTTSVGNLLMAHHAALLAHGLIGA